MATQSKIVNIRDYAKERAEYIRAKYDRENAAPRIIANPLGAAAVKAVLDQIPRVKAELNRPGK